jgi:hypothetical protein
MDAPLFARRYLSDGSIEVICRNCFDVWNVQAGEDAIPLLDKHVCESAQLSNPRLPQRPASSPLPKGKVRFGIRMPASLRRNKGTA